MIKQTVPKVIVIVVILLAVAFPLILLYRYFSPLGERLTYKYDDGSGRGFVGALGPSKRVGRVFEKGSPYEVLRSSLGYFSVRLPRIPLGLSQATVKIKFKNQKQNELLIGLKDRPQWHYLFKPLDNKLLNYLNWDIVKNDNFTLMQRSKIFTNLRKFLNSPPNNSVIANYFFDPSYLGVRAVELKDYAPSDTGLLIERTLRGSHTFYTYIKNEPLNFTIEKQDLNWRDGADPLIIRIYRNNTMVFSKIIPDDGITDSSKQIRGPLTGSVRLTLNEGTYKIKLSSSRDVLIKRIFTKQHLLLFENRLFLADNEDTYALTQTTPTTIYTDARSIGVEAENAPGIQDILVNEKRLQIAETRKRYSVSLPSGIKKIVSPKNDIIIKGAGFYSFTPESFLQPTPYKVIEFDEKLNLDDIDFIITSYRLPSEENGWLVNKQTFDLSQAFIEDGVLQFALYSPGARKNNEIWIDYIEVTLTKPSIFGGQ